MTAVVFHARQLARNLLAGARLALFLPLRGEAFRASSAQFALLTLFNFAIWVATAGARSEFAGDFQPTAIGVYLANVALVLATAFVVAHAYRQPERLILVAVALSAADALFDLLALALVAAGAADRHAGALYAGFVAWAWIASLRAAVVACGWRAPGVYLAGLAVTLMTALALIVIPDADVWELPDDDEDRMEATMTLTTDVTRNPYSHHD